MHYFVALHPGKCCLEQRKVQLKRISALQNKCVSLQKSHPYDSGKNTKLSGNPHSTFNADCYNLKTDKVINQLIDQESDKLILHIRNVK